MKKLLYILAGIAFAWAIPATLMAIVYYGSPELLAYMIVGGMLSLVGGAWGACIYNDMMGIHYDGD